MEQRISWRSVMCETKGLIPDYTHKPIRTNRKTEKNRQEWYNNKSLKRYRNCCNVCCALTGQEPVAGLGVYRICKNVLMEYSHVQKLRYGILVMGTGWFHTKHLMQLQPFSDLLCSLSEFKSFPIHSPELYALVASDTPSSEAGRNWAKNGR
jgi:hypothetical protein